MPRSREERAELSEGIVGEGRRLSRLVENLLDMSRIEAGKAEPHREPIDLREVLDAARGGLADPESVHLSADSELPMVDADAAQLERAFANLLENAVRYSDGEPVSVTSSSLGARVAVSVADRGPGIHRDERERIFEPFQHGDSGPAGDGAGLGLAIARGFVEANGGEISVDSRPGRGATFLVTLPERQGAGSS